jgi:glycosyltransferase involved in cell wall biosynthesis
MVKLFFLIRSLNVGGTERQLIELLKGLDKSTFNITVGLFYDEGLLRKEIGEITGVRLLSLSKKSRWDLLRFSFRLARVLSKLKPDILYSLLPEANITALIIGRYSGIPRIIWGIRASNMDIARYNWLSGASIRFCSWLSRFPDTIIVNSLAGHAYHRDLGYSSNRMVVIPNGIDTEKFKPEREAGLRLRAEWRIKEGAILIGLVGRLDPMKDHPTFLRAAQIIVQTQRDVCFICAGNGPDTYKNKLYNLSEEIGVKKKVLWLGERNDMPAVYSALDIATSSSSFGEGFSNVIGEAMSCGVPCVVTDVGDSASIVGDTGIVTPAKNPQALAAGWMTIIGRLKNDSQNIRKRVRDRIVANFSSNTLVHKTSEMLLGLYNEN